MTTHYKDNALAAKKVIQHVGKKIVVGCGVALAKPIGFLNALYQEACEDSSIELTIITGLTLAHPTFTSLLEKRFAEPLLERLLGNYKDPVYEQARLTQTLPPNIKILEFFFTPGKYLHNATVQQDYISSGYTNVVRDLAYYRPNVLAQQVARCQKDPTQFSLSSNTDLFHGVAAYLRDAERQGEPIAVVAEINNQLPFMLGDKAVVSTETWTDIIDTQHDTTLFTPPRMPVSWQENMIGLYSSCLVKDGGSLEIGFGSVGNAIASGLIFRHENNSDYQSVLKELKIEEKFHENVPDIRALGTFEQGLYAPTEMFSDEYLGLYRHGVLKKMVFDHLGLQKLFNQALIRTVPTIECLDALLTHKLIHSTLTEEDVVFLRKYGFFKPTIRYEAGALLTTENIKIAANLTDPKEKALIAAHCLGEKIIGGKILHAAVFFGSTAFYETLRNFSDEEKKLFEMTTVYHTNTLYWDIELARAQRQNARFMNSSLMFTLAGLAISDGLRNTQEVGGVGGQFDFINMSNQLEDARSVLNCRSTRETPRGIESNIVWDYPNVTVPRYLRDIFVTEYGIADCRSKTDSHVMKAILNITDSRFQAALLKKAQHFGKIPNDYSIPPEFQENFPEKNKKILKEIELKGYCKTYPFGSDFTEEENILVNALNLLKAQRGLKLVSFVWHALFARVAKKHTEKSLKRMQLDHPTNLTEWFYKKLLQYALQQISQHKDKIQV